MAAADGSMDSLDRTGIERAFGVLADRLASVGAPPTTLLAIGGAALVIQGFVRGTTRDVDIMALVDRPEERALLSAKPLPAYLAEAVAQVARDLDLSPGWLDTTVSALLEFAVPEGCLARSTLRTYGSHLRVYFIGRYEQIHIKTGAIVDLGIGVGARHVADLIALQPTREELLFAARLARTHNPYSASCELPMLLAQLGYAELIDEL